jgi:hypothetical protein
MPHHYFNGESLTAFCVVHEHAVFSTAEYTTETVVFRIFGVKPQGMQEIPLSLLDIHALMEFCQARVAAAAARALTKDTEPPNA